MNVELRFGSRREIKASGNMLGHEGVPTEIEILDVSQNGLAILTHLPKHIGDSCVVAFDVYLNHTVRRINAWGKVVYIEKQDKTTYRIGVQIRDQDALSRMHVEKLVELGSDLLNESYANIPCRYISTPDATTLATGDSGSRIACGVIERSAAKR